MTKALTFFVVVAFLAIARPVPAGGISNELLLSSAWCSFSYNQTTGYSKTTRVRFSRNGTYGTGSRGEGASVAHLTKRPANCAWQRAAA